MKTRCLIVDDEPLAVEVIESYLRRFDSVEVVAACHDAVSAMDVLQKERIDLIFLDIQMPHIKGTDFIRSLSHPPRVVFTTAYRDYALEGFELDALDYLLKPVSFERFIKAMNKYFEAAGSKSGSVGPQQSPDAAGSGSINIKSNRKIIRLSLDDILFIEGMKDYVNIVTARDQITTQTPLHTLDNMLPPAHFIRIHRSYIVRISKITAFTNEYIEVHGRQLPIGRHYKKNVLTMLAESSL